MQMEDNIKLDKEIPSIEQASTTLENINNIRKQLAILNLNFQELTYYENSIEPLLTILLSLSSAAYNLSGSSSVLAISPVVCSKRHDLKDTIHLVYDINEQCEDVYEQLKKRIDLLLKLGEC